ncbi:hypothetical protein Theco_3290 [Thermobacillus composti KWC4]|uniref:Thioredoxin domain-containing protein n=1 Tax=Thermobacillus composti (strain DSM 18247 / JCM 13945 / KWC4) TaxID=717605 RepID=L0EHT8_THECK|nr:hypothetical protein [Thermobacillus composti]AGA59342.1 hypothetical protein Theco_3290 [Thermobacillus composti KWC4]
MINAELVSHITLWIVVLLLVVGYMHMPQPWKRKNRLDLQNFGLPLQQKLPMLDIQSFNGDSIRDKTGTGKPSVLLFTSVGCQACNGLYPLLNAYADRKDVNLLLFVEGSITAIEHKIREHDIRIPIFHLEDDTLDRLNVTIFPFAYYLSGAGIISAKGGIPDADALELLLIEGLHAETQWLSAG